jgi:hypothetical protein
VASAELSKPILSRRSAFRGAGRRPERSCGMHEKSTFLAAPEPMRTSGTAPTDTDGGETPAETRKPRGRPPAHDDQWTKVTVVLLDRQVVFLDRLAADIRAANGSAVSRAHLIRALVDALGDSDVDLTSATSERDIKAVLTRRIRDTVL